MKQEIINEQIQDMLNMLDETGEFPQWRLENLSKDFKLMKACLNDMLLVINNFINKE